MVTSSARAPTTRFSSERRRALTLGFRLSALRLPVDSLQEDDMSGRLSVFVVGVVAALTISYLVDNHTVSGQSPTRFAAVPSAKGGQDIFGAYDVVADWPKDLSTIKGHEGWTFGAGQSVFAESPNRIFVLQRGELPALMRPNTISL